MPDKYNIKAVALDFDGTILKKEMIPIDIIVRLAAFAKTGGTFIPATGRSVGVIVEILRSSGAVDHIGFPKYIVSGQKYAFVFNGKGYAALGNHNFEYNASWKKLLEQIRVRFSGVENKMKQCGLVCSLCEPDYDTQILTGHIDFAFETEDCARRGEKEIRSIFADIAGVQIVRNARLIILLCAGAGKGPALIHVLKNADIAPREVMTVGDSLNDLSMLDGELGFRCATVANADPVVIRAVKKAGGYVADGRVAGGLLEIFDVFSIGLIT